MTTKNPTTLLLTGGRWLAITAAVVLLSGKLIHSGQECGGCSTHCHTSPKTSTASSRPCPFGCEHHSHENPCTPSGEESPGDHDEHECAVCSVLSHVIECPEIVGLPDESDLITATVGPDSVSADAEIFFSIHPRGPPALV